MFKSYKVKFTITTFVLVFGVTIFALWGIYQKALYKLEIEIQNRLMAISKNSVLQIDDQIHTKLFNSYLRQVPNIEKTPEFLAVKKTLVEIKLRNELPSEVYTIVNPTWAEDKILFLAMTDETPYVGNALKKKKWMKATFQNGKTTSSSRYKDEEGYWISALSPIKNSKGEVIAALEVDMNIEKELHAVQMAYLKALVLPLLLASVLALFFGNLIGSELTKKLQLLSKQADRIGDENFGEIIVDDGTDEVSDLIKVFNQMSLTLEMKKDLLLEAQAEMTRKSNLASIGEMSANIAHEINNPMTVMGNNIELLQKKIEKGEEVASEKLEKSLKTMGKMLIRMDKIVQGLKKISRDGYNEDFEYFQVSEMVEETLDLCLGRLETYGVQIEVAVSCESVELYGSMVQISQVLINLINNSIDAIKENDEKWIRVETIDTNQFTEIVVTDSGSGIPMEIQKKMFEPFFTSKKAGEGTGIGMSISTSIIDEHGGKMSINNNCPNTQFVLQFPKRNSLKMAA